VLCGWCGLYGSVGLVGLFLVCSDLVFWCLVFWCCFVIHVVLCVGGLVFGFSGCLVWCRCL